MPNMLGIDALKAIRAAGIKTPLLMVTTEGERTNVITAIQAGANNYLIKPFEKDDFCKIVSQLVNFSAISETEVGEKMEDVEEDKIETPTVVDLGSGMIKRE
jgi:DNA-binding NarL/FixJ family response regulator